MSSYKQLITEKIIKELADDSVWTVDDAMKKWWMTPRYDGLRLTDMGDLSFRIAKIEFYNYDLILDSKTSWQNAILEMNKKIKCPYYIGVNKNKDSKKPFIRLYDSKIAIMVSLYGNIQEYLKSLKVQNDRKEK